jgi:hypothetical protein
MRLRASFFWRRWRSCGWGSPSRTSARYEREPLRERDRVDPLRLREPLLRDEPLLLDEPLLREPPLRDDPELREAVLRERDELEPLRERDDDERDEPLPLRERDDVLRLRRVPPLRCAAGISAVATAFVSCGIRRSRKLDIRSSSRRMRLAS